MKHSNNRHLLFERFWHPFKSVVQSQGLNKRGLGFQNRQVCECHMVSVVNASDGKKEYLIKDAANDHLTKDVKLKDTPLELEDGGQAIIDELVEINLGSKDDLKPILLSAQLTQKGK